MLFAVLLSRVCSVSLGLGWWLWMIADPWIKREQSKQGVVAICNLPCFGRVVLHVNCTAIMLTLRCVRLLALGTRCAMRDY